MKFSLWLNENNDDLQILIKSLQEKYPEIENLFAWENDYKVFLNELRIKKEYRNRGIGSTVVQELKKFAASVDKPLVLEPEPDKGKKAALDRFYRRQGMVPNKGRNKDYKLSAAFAPTMYWKPERDK